jgi:hypothetical protein
MKYKIEIKFEKTAARARKHKPNHSGQFPVKSDALDADYARDFLKNHPDHVDIFKDPSEYRSKWHPDGTSYILHGDASLSRLPRGHFGYIDDVTKDMSHALSNSKKQRYIRNKDGFGYELLHHLFDGGIRVYAYNRKLYITAYQVPTDEQLSMIKEICDQRESSIIDADIELYKIGRLYGHYKTFNSFEKFKDFVLSLRYKHETADQDAIKRIQLLQSFRDDSKEEAPYKIPQGLGVKPKPVGELGKLTKEEIQSVIEKYPALRNMEKSARNRAIIKIAERLDKHNCYQQSDWVMEMLSGHLAE